MSCYEIINKIVANRNGNNNIWVCSEQVKLQAYNQKEDTAELWVISQRVWPMENCAVVSSTVATPIVIVKGWMRPNSLLLLLLLLPLARQCLEMNDELLCCAPELMKICIITLPQVHIFSTTQRPLHRRARVSGCALEKCMENQQMVTENNSSFRFR